MSYDIILHAAKTTKASPPLNTLITEYDFNNALKESNQTEQELLDFLNLHFNFKLMKKENFPTNKGNLKFYNFRCQ
ncbi:MAG: hypothetical protein GX867_08195 [Tissierellia bacterium]|nr:hypothetical protein [Tissierellia bacterium]